MHLWFRLHSFTYTLPGQHVRSLAQNQRMQSQVLPPPAPPRAAPLSLLQTSVANLPAVPSHWTRGMLVSLPVGCLPTALCCVGGTGEAALCIRIVRGLHLLCCLPKQPQPVDTGAKPHFEQHFNSCAPSWRLQCQLWMLMARRWSTRMAW